MDNSELKEKHEQALPTDEMYRFFPPKEEILLVNSNPEKNYRFIFNGHPKTEFEKKNLSKYLEYESQKGKLNYPNDWLESDTMRLLQASEYDIKKAYKTIDENINFRNKISKTINEKIISLLNSGFLYVYGRDHHFRPIIIVSIKTCVKLISKKEYVFEDISEAILYLLNYILKYIFIPGQIENWIILVDFKDVGLSEVSEFKKILGVLNVYRGRVYRNYIINISGFLKMAVKTALNVFGSSTSNKLKILGSDELNKLQEIISPDNIQKIYGGTAPDITPGLTKLFPPIMPSKNYAINGEKINIVSENEYKEMCLYSKPFKPFVISPKYEKLWKEENEKDTTKSSIKESQKPKYEKLNNEKEIKAQELPKKQNNIFERERMKEIGRQKLTKHKNQLMIQNKKNIMTFLKEFEELKLIENREERKYYNFSPVNIVEIKYFFKKLQKNKKFYIIN